MNTKTHLTIVLYLFLQLCFTEILSIVFYILENGDFFAGINNLFVYASSAILIAVISAAKYKIIKSLLKMEIILSLVYELSISFRLISIVVEVIYDDFFPIFILGSMNIANIINLLCIISFITYLALIPSCHKKSYIFKDILKYLVLTIVYKFVEIGFWFLIFNNSSSDHVMSTDYNTDFLITTAANILGILIFLYIYLSSKIKLNNKGENPEYSTLEVIVLFIGTMPIIHLASFVMIIMFLLHGGF